MKKVLSTAMLTVLSLCLWAPLALAAGGGDTKFSVGAYLAIGSGLAMGLAALGGALGQGRAAAAALEGIARNPGASNKIFTPMLLGLAFIESLVLFTLLIAFLLQGQIGAVIG